MSLDGAGNRSCTAAVNSLISIYGSNLSYSPGVSAAYPWPLKLVDTTVTIDNVPCPLNYVGPSQVNALVPAQLQPGTYTLTLQNPVGQASTIFYLVPFLPAYFTLSAAPPCTSSCLVCVSHVCPSVAALDANYALISPAHPAVPGQVISLFLTGLGVTSYIKASYYSTLNTVEGWLGAITFVGKVPGYEGLDQINIKPKLSDFLNCYPVSPYVRLGFYLRRRESDGLVRSGSVAGGDKGGSVARVAHQSEKVCL